MYNIEDKFIYEVLEDYKDAKDDAERDEIFTALTNKIWSTKNSRSFSTKYFKYSVPDYMSGAIADVFRKYTKIPYKAYQSKTNNIESWHLLRQKINNIYTHVCDTRLCIAEDYLNALKTPQTLYWQHMKEPLKINADELETQIQNALTQADVLLLKHSKEKLPLTWREYKMLVDDWMGRIVRNYIPFEQLKQAPKLDLYSQCWNEDNYVIRYIGKSISGYIKNYQKQHYNVPRNKKYKRCECGNLFVQHSNSHKFCEACQRTNTIKKHRKYNAKRLTTNRND